jgi:hypothetical protein
MIEYHLKASSLKMSWQFIVSESSSGLQMNVARATNNVDLAEHDNSLTQA